MDSEVASVNSHQMDDFLSDIILVLLDNDNICSSIVDKTHNYEVLHFRNLNDAFSAIDDKCNTLKLILTSIGTADSKGCSTVRHVGNERLMPVVFLPEKDKEVLFQVLGGGGVTVYHIKNVNLDDIKDIWHHIFLHKQRNKCATNTYDDVIKLQKHAVAPADSASTSAARDQDAAQLKGSSGGSDVAKKARVVWTIELNNRFIEAYNQLGHEGATPCRILELMNDPRLSRFHIASHLQKYRTHLRQMQEDINPRRSKFRYKVNNPNFSSGCHVKYSSMQQPQEFSTQQPPVNAAASFTKFLSEMEDEELFTLAQNHQIPSLNPDDSQLSLDWDTISSTVLDLPQLPNSNKFNEMYSMLENCVSGETYSNTYVGFKISNEGELIWDKSAHQAASQVTITDAPSAAQLSPPAKQPDSGIDSPVALDMESCFYISELLGTDSSFQ